MGKSGLLSAPGVRSHINIHTNALSAAVYLSFPLFLVHSCQLLNPISSWICIMHEDDWPSHASSLRDPSPLDMFARPWPL